MHGVKIGVIGASSVVSWLEAVEGEQTSRKRWLQVHPGTRGCVCAFAAYQVFPLLSGGGVNNNNNNKDVIVLGGASSAL